MQLYCSIIVIISIHELKSQQQTSLLLLLVIALAEGADEEDLEGVGRRLPGHAVRHQRVQGCGPHQRVHDSRLGQVVQRRRQARRQHPSRRFVCRARRLPVQMIQGILMSRERCARNFMNFQHF